MFYVRGSDISILLRECHFIEPVGAAAGGLGVGSSLLDPSLFDKRLEGAAVKQVVKNPVGFSHTRLTVAMILSAISRASSTSSSDASSMCRN